jgi:hypothetical protein
VKDMEPYFEVHKIVRNDFELPKAGLRQSGRR